MSTQLLHIERSDGDLVLVQDTFKGHIFLRIITTKLGSLAMQARYEGKPVPAMFARPLKHSVVLRVSELGPLIRVLQDAQREIGYTGPPARVAHEREPPRTTTQPR